MQARLAAGEITQDEYDRWKGWYADRAQAQQDRQGLADEYDQRLSQLPPDQQKKFADRKVDKYGAATNEAAAAGLSAPKREVVYTAVDEDRFSGNVALKNSNAEERFLTGGGSSLGGNALSGGTSMASALTGGSALAGKTPPVKSAFVQATGPVEQTTPALQPENDKLQDATHGGPPVGLG